MTSPNAAVSSYMAEIGRKGGKKKSPAKTRACRKNPRKRKS